jgi:hypothetical protein
MALFSGKEVSPASPGWAGPCPSEVPCTPGRSFKELNTGYQKGHY